MTKRLTKKQFKERCDEMFNILHRQSSYRSGNNATYGGIWRDAKPLIRWETYYVNQRCFIGVKDLPIHCLALLTRIHKYSPPVTEIIQKHYLKWLTKESVWSEVFYRRPISKIMSVGAILKTNKPANFMFSALSASRYGSEHPWIVYLWYYLCKKNPSIDKHLAFLISHFCCIESNNYFFFKEAGAGNLWDEHFCIGAKQICMSELKDFCSGQKKEENLLDTYYKLGYFKRYGSHKNVFGVFCSYKDDDKRLHLYVTDCFRRLFKPAYGVIKQDLFGREYKSMSLTRNRMVSILEQICLEIQDKYL